MPQRKPTQPAQPDNVAPAHPLTDVEFRDLVEGAMRASPDGKAGEWTVVNEQALLDDIDRWWGVLMAMKKSVETQLAAKHDEVRVARLSRQGREMVQEDVDAETTYGVWHAGAVRFKNKAETEMIRVNLLRRQRVPDLYRELISEERSYWLHRAGWLTEAIANHQADSAAAGREPSSEDATLWEVVTAAPTQPPRADA